MEAQFRCIFAFGPHEDEHQPKHQHSFQAYSPKFLPDIVDGSLFSKLISIPSTEIFGDLIKVVMNLSPTKWITSIKLKAITLDESAFAVTVRSPWQESFPDPRAMVKIAPGQLQQMEASIDVQFVKQSDHADECTKFKILVEDGRLQ